MKLCISKSYGGQVVFDNFALEIEEGKILCVLGESGGGKTTLLNILAGLTAYEGVIDGAPKKVGYIFQEPRLLPNLTVEENLRYAGGRPEKIDELLAKTEKEKTARPFGGRKTAGCLCARLFERRGGPPFRRALFLPRYRAENSSGGSLCRPLESGEKDDGVRHPRYRGRLYARPSGDRVAQGKNRAGYGDGRGGVAPKIRGKLGRERKNSVGFVGKIKIFRQNRLFLSIKERIIKGET